MLIYTNTITNLLKKLSKDKEYDPLCMVESNIDFTSFTSIDEYNMGTVPEDEWDRTQIKLSALVIFNCPSCNLRQTANYSAINSQKFCGHSECEYGVKQKKLSMYFITRLYLLCGQRLITPEYKNVRSKMTSICMKCDKKSIQPFLNFKSKSCENELCPLYHQQIDDMGNITTVKNMVGRKNIDYKKLYEPEGFFIEHNPSNEDEIVKFKCPNDHIFNMKLSIFKKWINGKRGEYPCDICNCVSRWKEMIDELKAFGIDKILENKSTTYTPSDKIKFMCPSEKHELEFDRASIQNCVKRNNGESYRCKFCNKSCMAKTKLTQIKEKFTTLGIKLKSHNHISKTIEYKCMCGDTRTTSYDTCLKESWKGCSACVYKNPDTVYKMIHKRDAIYKLVNGKTIYCQGYEGIAIDYLLNNGEEYSNIIYGEELKSHMLRYKMNGKYKTYFPDIVLKSTNTIVEVKCTTFLRKGELSCKLKACLNEKYNFRLMMYTDKAKLLYIENISVTGDRKLESMVDFIDPSIIMTDNEITIDIGFSSYKSSDNKREVSIEFDFSDNEEIVEQENKDGDSCVTNSCVTDDKLKDLFVNVETIDDQNKVIEDDETWAPYEDLFVSSLGKIKKDNKLYKMQKDFSYKIVVNNKSKTYRIGRLMAAAFNHPDVELLKLKNYNIYFPNDIIDVKTMKIMLRSDIFKLSSNKKLPPTTDEGKQIIEEYKSKILNYGTDKFIREVNDMSKIAIKHKLTQMGASSLSSLTKKGLVDLFIKMFEHSQ